MDYRWFGNKQTIQLFDPKFHHGSIITSCSHVLWPSPDLYKCKGMNDTICFGLSGNIRSIDGRWRLNDTQMTSSLSPSRRKIFYGIFAWGLSLLSSVSLFTIQVILAHFAQYCKLVAMIVIQTLFISVNMAGDCFQQVELSSYSWKRSLLLGSGQS